MEPVEITKEIGRHFKESLYFFHLTGFDKPNKKNVLWWIKITHGCYAHIISFIFQIFYLSKEFSVTELSIEFSCLWAPFMNVITTVQWYRMREKISYAMEQVLQKQIDCGEVDESTMKDIHKEEKMKRNFIYVYTLFAIVTISCATIAWILLFSFNHSKVEKMPTTIQFPFPASFPFDYRATKIGFFLCGLLVLSMYVNIAINSIATSALFYSYTTFASIHFKSLSYFYRTIHNRCTRDINLNTSIDFNKKMNQEIKKCIRYSDKILKFCEMINNTYQMLFFVLTSFSVISMTWVLVILTTIPVSDENYTTFLLIFLATMYQCFLFCFFGDRLTTEADKIQYSVYSNDWIAVDKSFKKSMLIVNMRMSRQVEIKVAKVIPLKLESFIQILRAAYSFLAVYKQ